PAKSSTGPGRAGSTRPTSPATISKTASAQSRAVVIVGRGPRASRVGSSLVPSRGRRGTAADRDGTGAAVPTVLGRVALRRDQHLAERAVPVERGVRVHP